MEKVILERFCHASYGEFGDLILPSGETLATVEQPWIQNLPNISCIPIGTYLCKPRFYNRGGYEAVEVTEVEGRSHILFHVGNFVSNSRGCILLNERHGAMTDGTLRGVNSRKVFNHFMSNMGKEPFSLVIKNKNSGVL